MGFLKIRLNKYYESRDHNESVQVNNNNLKNYLIKC